MIELPEALIIAQQIGAELKGKRIASGVRGNAPHKFAFYSRPPEEYAAILKDRAVGEADANGSMIRVKVEPDYVLVLGEGGERILFHPNETTLPKKHQLLLHFEDETYLTVTVQGWGAALLLHESEVDAHPEAGRKGVSPLSGAFTTAYFEQRFGALEPDDARSVKYFVISKPGVWGVGNGYLQDILFRARVHPRRRAVSLTDSERQALYTAIRETLQQAVDQNGRDTERNLYNRPGGYTRILDSRTVGKPCPECGTSIEKAQFLGGAVYFCPRCQV